MNRKYCLTLVVAGAALAGCNRKDSSSAVGGNGLSTNALQQQVQQTYQSTKEFVAKEKTAFVDSAEQKLRDLDTKIDALSEEVAKAKPEVQEQAKSGLAKLKEQRTALQQKIEDLKASGQQGWDKTKDAFSTTWQDLEKTYQDTKAKLEQ